MLEIFPQTARRVDEWKADPGVMGVVLVGSKSHGHGDELSDDDLEVLYTDEAFARFAPVDCIDLLVEGEGESRKLIYDAQLTSLIDLQRKPGSTLDLDHWPYEKARVLFDRDGSVSAAVEAAGRMDPDFRAKRLKYATVDAWVAPYRAIKTARRGYRGSVSILIARGAKALIRIVFALEGRWVPLDHWIEAEMKTLQDPEQVVPLILEALSDGKSEPLTEALKRLENRLFEAGVPRPEGRHDLFMELIHPSRAADWAIYALP
jgi:hypothetical protein